MNPQPRITVEALHLRPGDLVEVRSEEEILATLDSGGALDGLPFMPEMLAYCGKRFRVFKRSDKTCDTLYYSGSRRMYNTVHLDGVRCSGAAHGGCQARCLIFWKEAWLKRVDPQPIANPLQVTSCSVAEGCTREQLMAAVHPAAAPDDGEERFRCQATDLLKASKPMPWWDVRQYWRDWASGNVTFMQLVRAAMFRIFMKMLKVGGYRALLWTYNRIQAWRGGTPYPYVYGTPKKCPRATLDLQPGEWVRVKSHKEILETVNDSNRNYGLSFDPEMVRYCGTLQRVATRVERIVDERTGKLLRIGRDCIILENAYCRAEYSHRRLFCPRALYPFWREIWLTRVPASEVEAVKAGAGKAERELEPANAHARWTVTAAFLGAALVSGAAVTIYYQSGIPEYSPPTVRLAHAVNTTARPMRASGPLRVHPTNPRYFVDATGRAVLLTGSHTWASFHDNGPGDPPPKFDYERYLDFLQANGHNFFRLWAWEQSRWGPWTTSDDYFFSPGPAYLRTGPGLALDGKPRFDVTRFNPEFFERLRERVRLAEERGIYVAVMLFNGWAIDNKHSHLLRGNPWHGYPFNGHNNINGIDGDPNGNDGGEETHQLLVPQVTAAQEEYVRRVVDAVNEFDNVLFEISNESYASSRDWQFRMIDLIHRYEAEKPKQHPVGMTQYQWPGNNAELFASPADWIAPWEQLPEYPYRDQPLPADGRKVVIVDTDHLWGIGGDRQWAWKTFLRGNHPTFMDGYDGAAVGVGAPAPWDIRTVGWKGIVKDLLQMERRATGWEPDHPQWVHLRTNLGYIGAYARRMHLAEMTPQPKLCSTGYCLARSNAGAAEYLVYAEDSSRPIEVDLSGYTGTLRSEWFDPLTARRLAGPVVQGGARREFRSPFEEDAVLYLSSSAPRPAFAELKDESATRQGGVAK